MLSLKTDVDVPIVSIVISKKLETIVFFVGILKVTSITSSIRIQGSGSASKCHGSGTLFFFNMYGTQYQ
jgi:hypothetical protein